MGFAVENGTRFFFVDTGRFSWGTVRGLPWLTGRRFYGHVRKFAAAKSHRRGPRIVFFSKNPRRLSIER